MIDIADLSSVSDELWGQWVDFSDLKIENGRVAVPFGRPVRAGRWEVAPTEVSGVVEVDRVISVDVEDPLSCPWWQAFHGLEVRDVPSLEIAISGGQLVVARLKVERVAITVR